LSSIETKKFAPGDYIIKEGDSDAHIYVINIGRVEVTKGDKSLGELKDGDFFGEMSFLTGEMRSASVVAKEDSTIFKLDAKSFLEMIKKNPELALKIMRGLAEKLKAANEKFIS
jgi:CRP-like cAMP-binding protein